MPQGFNRLYVNMIKAGEAGGALEVILQRLAEFQERSESLKRKVKGAMIYPVVVVTVAVGILTFIMIKIVPEFEKIFDDFGLELPPMTLVLIAMSNWTVKYWYLIPGIPIGIWLLIKLIRKFKHGRMGWDMFALKLPIFGTLVEKNILARTTRTLGTLVASGVPILEALDHHPRDGRQRHLRADVRQGHRSDPRGRNDRQADEGVLRGRLPPGGGSSSSRSACRSSGRWSTC